MPDRPTAADGRRLKAAAILGGLALGVLVLLAWSQDWFSLTLVGDVPTVVGVPGATAAPALSALALASLALAAALSIAGMVFRILLGVLEVALGACVVLSAIVAISDPVAAGARTVTDATGVDGESSIAALVADTATSPWPGVSLALGIALALLGTAILVTAGRWPGGSRRYSAVRLTDAENDADAAPDSITDWDSLSEGQDPTEPPRRPTAR